MRKSVKANKLKSVLVALGLIIVLIITYFLADGELLSKNASFDASQSFVRFLDVGQGDAALIYSNGYSALIDTGTSESANDVCIALDSCGIERIDVLIISHLHTDHTGGVEMIAEQFGIDNVILPELSVGSEGLGHAEYLINKVTSTGGEIYTAKQGMNFTVGEFEITVLASFDKLDDENNRSIMLAAEIDDKRFIFTGDAEVKAENMLLNEGLDLKCDVFKAGHHGSSTSNSEKLLSEMRPEFAVVSAGANNMYGHPHREVLSAFEHFDIEVLRTDLIGDITFYVKKGHINPKYEK